jgi:hypothetical protein
MTNSCEEERKDIYARTRQDLLTRNLSNSERYDNAILTLSTGVLGLSLAFIKDIVSLDRSQYVLLLEISWWAFGASILSVLVSFVLSQLGIKRQLEYAGKYYLDGEDEYLRKKNSPAFWTEIMNYASGVLFLVGIVTTIFFVSVNIKGEFTMPKVKDGASIPTFQKTLTEGVKKGATVPEMQPVKQPATTSQESGSQDSQSGGDSGQTKK